MARDLTVGMVATTEEALLRPAIFVELETASETVRVWSGIGTKTWPAATGSPPSGDKQWEGVGIFGSISPMTETREIRAEGMQLVLSGIKSSMVTLAMSEALPLKPCRVWLGFQEANGDVIADPYQSFAGRTDAIKFTESGESSTITISVESRLIDLQRARQWRYSDRDQRHVFPDDIGFQRVEELQNKEIVWGRRTDPAPTTPPPLPMQPRQDE